MQGILGIVILMGFTWCLSENRKKQNMKTIFGCLFLQILLALIFFKIPLSKIIFLWMNQCVELLQNASNAGAQFVFGYLGGSPAPFEATDPSKGFIFAFQVLPLLLVISAISSILFYWKILPKVVLAIGAVLKKATGVSGAVGLAVAANIFVGMVEAPIMVRPYISRMTRSELFILMTSGMATIAGTVMVFYAMLLKTTIPDSLAHILVASIISAPASIMISSIMVPEQSESVIRGTNIELEQAASSTMDALIRGVEDGIKLMLNIGAVLIVLVAIVSLINSILAFIPAGDSPVTLQSILGYVMAPVVWLIGIPWSEAHVAGQLMGTKTILNGLLAYIDLANLESGVLCERSRIIMTYAICGFANLASLGIMVSGLKTMAPDRTKEIMSLGFKSVVAGTIATLITGALAGILV